MPQIMYDEIPGLLEQGLNAEAIAERFGVTKGSLHVQCCKRGISLRAKRDRKVRRGSIDKPLALSDATVVMLKEKARQMNVHPATLARSLIETIVKDNLYSAVLDI